MKSKRKQRFMWLCTFSLALAFVVMLLPMDVAAKTLKSGKYEYTVLENGTVEITKYTGSARSLTIPNTLAGKKVTRIADYAFTKYEDKNKDGILEDASTIRKVTFPNTLKYIGNWNFSYLTSIHIPASVTDIGSRAFVTKDVTSITVASGNKVYDSRNNCNAIIKKSFYDEYRKEKLVELTLGCKNTVIPKGVTSIGSDAFGGGGIKKITIPTGVKYIGYCAFFGADITSITLPDTVVSLGGCTFSHCKKLKSVKLSRKLKEIENNDFEGCTSLKSITIPTSVKRIGWSGFQGCTALKSINIPTSVQTIDSYAFEGCSKLQKVVIGKNVKKIGMYAFSGDKKLTRITVKSTKLNKKSVGKAALKGTNKKLVIKVPKAKVTEYKNYFSNKGNKTVKVKK